MVSLQWKPFVVVGLLNLGAALFAAVKLKVLTMPFFIVPFQHRFGVFGQIILFALMASTNPFFIPQYSFSSHATLQDLELFFAIAWAIWFNRNKIVYKDSSLLPLQVWKMAKNVSEDFVSSATWDLGQPRTTPSSWVPPPSGFHKINVDGASSELDSFSSVGVVIRDCKGDVVAALCKPLQTRFFAKLTEVFSLEHGILLAQELHLAWVIVESNSLNAIQAINEGATGGSLGHILQGILQVSVSFESCLFKHINRSFNTPWKGVAPHYISSFLQSNLNVNDL